MTSFENWIKERKFIILNNDKQPTHKLSGKGAKFYTYNEVKNESNLAILVDENYVVLDTDTKQDSLSLWKLCKFYNLTPLIMETTKGLHFWFKSDKVLKNNVKVKLNSGIYVDIRCYGKISYVKIKDKNKWRKWINKDVNNISFLDKETTPTNHPLLVSLECAYNIDKGNREMNLFKRLQPLKELNYSLAEFKEHLIFINTQLFREKLNIKEINNLVKQYEALPEQSLNFYHKNTFLHNDFADYFIDIFKVKRQNDLLYMYDENRNIYTSEKKSFFQYFIKLCAIIKKNQRQEAYEHLLYKEVPEIDNNFINDYINLENGLFNLDNFILKAHTNEIFTNIKFNFKYVANAYDKNLDKFLNSITDNQQELRLLLEEFLGYCLLNKSIYQKAFLLYGPQGANGKSTFLDMLKEWVGKENVSNVSLENLEERFSKALLLNKVINIGADISSAEIKESQVFKKLVTGDGITAEFKGQTPFTLYNSAKLIFSANKIPTSQDKSSAYYRRWIIIPFLKNFKEKERDPFILQKLITDNAKSYLFILALNGLKRLKQNNSFTSCKIVENIMNEYITNNSSVLQWLESYHKQNNNLINKEVDIAYTHYKDYCHQYMFKAMTLQNFIKIIIDTEKYDVEFKNTPHLGKIRFFILKN